MGIGHHTTDEVGFGLVEGGHQVVQLALEVGGHGLAALALLPVLVLRSLQWLEREKEFSTISSSFSCGSDGILPGQDDPQSIESPVRLIHS